MDSCDDVWTLFDRLGLAPNCNDIEDGGGSIVDHIDDDVVVGAEE